MHVTLRFFCILSLILLWWVAEWNIILLIVEHYADDSKLREFSIYIGILVTILLLMHFEPGLMRHLL